MPGGMRPYLITWLRRTARLLTRTGLVLVLTGLPFLLTGLPFLLTGLPACAEPLVNWENGFEINLPATWLRQEGGAKGIKVASDDVRINFEPYFGTTMAEQIERLHKETKANGYQFKNERSYTIHEVPAHEMVFYRDGKYLIYYVLVAGHRGFLITLQSEGTDSVAFREAQDIISDFRVKPRD